MRAAVILVGDELLAGHTRDANAHFIAQRLSALGHKLRRVSIVPDETHVIEAELEACSQVAEIVFVSGGLGPTHDDRTTEAMAAHFGRNIVIEETAWKKLLKRYGDRPWVNDATKNAARKMVSIPEGVEALDNPAGAACGYMLREGGVIYVVMPGVPAELQAIFETHIVGHVLPRGENVTLVEIDIEMAEAVFAACLGDVAQKFADIEIGSYPHYGERRVTLRFKGEAARARAALDAFLEAQPDARDRIVGAKPV